MTSPEPTGPRESIALLGAGGTMGRPMAANLLAAGYGVRAWNRSREKAESLSDDGAVICDTAAEAARGASLLITMLSNGEALSEALDGIELAEGPPAPLWVQMGTIGETDTEHCAQLARDRSVAFIDAPVSGTKQPAEQGKLVILASGPDELRDRVTPIFDVLGHKTVWAGEAGNGTRLKLAINNWLLAVVEGAAETLALAGAMGLDPHIVLEAIADGPLDAPYLQLKGSAMLERSFDPAFSLAMATKDAGLVSDAAHRRDLDLPAQEAIHQRFRAGAETHGDEDLSAIYLLSAPADSERG